MIWKRYKGSFMSKRPGKGDTVEQKVVANLPWTDLFEKIKQKYFQLKIVIIKGFFWSLKHEKSIKNILEEL